MEAGECICLGRLLVDGGLDTFDFWGDTPHDPGEGMAASSAYGSPKGELAGEGICWLICTGLDSGTPWKDWALCMSQVAGVREMEKLWDLVGVGSLLYMDKSKELFMGVGSGVRGEVSWGVS